MKRLAPWFLLLGAGAASAWLAWQGARGGDNGIPLRLPAPGASRAPSLPESPSPVGPADPPPQWAKVSREQMDEAARYRVPVAFENDLGLRFVLIPAGSFLMGSPEGEAGRRADEARHEVRLSRPYYLQVAELTNAQLRHWDEGHPGYDRDCGEFRGYSLATDSQPAVQVSWEAAVSFACWLSREDPHRSYALPTEAQWEFACRAGTIERFWWGPDASLSDGWRYANANDVRTANWLELTWEGWPQYDGYRVTAPISSYPPNGWGLYDMAGNVWEWCADLYGPYPKGAVVDPTGSLKGGARVLRGGSWLFDPASVRSAARVCDGPEARSINVGFRLVSPLPR